ncbi:ferredoxin-NADP reductase [Rhodococcus sp. 27YEA15]|uniref:PDR/VanB family oxidoreductase n=1 Tax=Rhodococcus sp. 27YEA15 TaxID=3156259 RepID=UPI003C79D52B
MFCDDGLFPTIVVDRHDEADGVVSLTLALPDAGELPRWAPGAHIDVAVLDGEVRQYSLCGDPSTADSWRIAVLLQPHGRGGSDYLHRTARIGSTLRVSLPRNNFPLIRSESYIFVAGGIGITPILPMIEAAQSAGSPWRLYYGGRTTSSMAFLDELAPYASLVSVVSQQDSGLLPIAQIVAGGPDGAQVYCCGPEPLSAAVEAECAAVGVRLHVERFAPRPVGDASSSETAFDVRLAGSGVTVRVEADQSILAAVELAGIVVEASCREGTCASCETTVLEGEVDHLDSVLTEDERRQNSSMMLCVSRARTATLVLDL